MTAFLGNATLKTAAVISSEAAVAAAPSSLDERAAKSLLASLSNSGTIEGCGGGSGFWAVGCAKPTAGEALTPFEALAAPSGLPLANFPLSFTGYVGSGSFTCGISFTGDSGDFRSDDRGGEVGRDRRASQMWRSTAVTPRWPSLDSVRPPSRR